MMLIMYFVESCDKDGYYDVIFKKRFYVNYKDGE